MFLFLMIFILGNQAQSNDCPDKLERILEQRNAERRAKAIERESALEADYAQKGAGYVLKNMWQYAGYGVDPQKIAARLIDEDNRRREVQNMSDARNRLAADLATHGAQYVVRNSFTYAPIRTSEISQMLFKKR